ncbi:MAG: serine/threonine protein kinase [Chelatococcus sp.]|nr:MAG: serine/threonine protein kinase [Chelatococcus sp.]
MSDSERTVFAPRGGGGVAIGTRLNGIYEIESLIGVGGMGEVYRGRAIQTGDAVAIKMIRPDMARDESALALFRREAAALHNLYNEAIVRYYVFTIDPVTEAPYLAMEFVDGQPLSERIRERPLTLEEADVLRRRIAPGLHAAHLLGIVHRDISPDNIILPGGNPARAKIIDFGIARSSLLGEGTVIGSGFAGKYNYVSPEQLGLYGGEVTGRSDMYSFGLVLAEALTGKAIDMGGTQVQIVEKRRRVPDLAAVDARIRPLLARMLAPDPADRAADMAEVAAWQPPVARGSAGLPWRAVAAMALVALLGGGGYYGWTRLAPATPPGGKAGTATPPPLSEGRPAADPASARPPAEAPALIEPERPAPPQQGAEPPQLSPPTPALTPPPSTPPAAPPQQTSGQGGEVPAEQRPRPQQTPASERPRPQPSEPQAPVAPSQPSGPSPQPQLGPPPGSEKPPSAVSEPPPRTQAERIERYIRDYAGGSCFFLWPIEIAEKRVIVEGFGNGAEPFVAFDSAFKAAHGFEAQIHLRPLTNAQCPMAEFLRGLGGAIDRSPRLQIGSFNMKSGEVLTGSVEAGGGLNLDVVLIGDDGLVYNLASFLKREGTRVSFNLKLESTGGSARPQTVLALVTPSALPTLSGPNPAPASEFFANLKNDLDRQGVKLGLGLRYFRIE